jgi:hypothetical protein
MDTLSVILQEVSKSQSLNFPTIIAIVKDVATIAAILIGIYYGRKGLKRLLLDDIVKRKISDLHNTNREVSIITGKIVAELAHKEDLNRPVNEEDLSFIKMQTGKLVDCTTGASKEVATLAFFLDETIKRIDPSVESSTYRERRFASDFYYLLYNTCLKINQFSGNIIDLPRKIRLEPYNEINRSLHRFLSREETYRIKGVQFGLNLNANSSLSLLFSSIINRSTFTYIFKKRFFQLLQTNTPIIYELFVNNIYFPVMLESCTEHPFVGKPTLHLVKFEMRRSIMLDKEKQTIEFFYSNINPIFKFVQNIKVDEFVKNYKDAFIKDENLFASLSLKVMILADETMSITCEKSDAERYFKKVNRRLTKRIKRIKKNG